MNRKISVGMMVTIVILAMTVTFSMTMLLAMRLFDSTVSSVKEKESMYNKISEVDRYVRANDYYNIDETLLYDCLTAGYLLGAGDPYARYYTATSYTELMKIQEGTLMGIGVELAKDQTGYAKVLKVYDDSPAQEAGIQVGDYLTAIGGEEVKAMYTVDTVHTRLRGEAGTVVSVTWLDAAAAEHSADLTHYGYRTTSVDQTLLQGNVGYIHIRQFDSTTVSELDYAVRTLRNAGAASLVFDLRDNGGGVLEDALNCIDLLCPEGTLAYAEDKSGKRTLLGSSDAENLVELPMVCIVNKRTASAAELFAASLRSLSGARLVGETTQGKGTIQSSPQRLSDGSALVVTVAKLLDGQGESFDGTGLTVDVERPLTAEEEVIFYDFTPETDPQILRAVQAAQQMSGSTTVAGTEEENASSAPEQADPEGEAASDSASSEEASSESDASSEQAASSDAASSQSAEAASSQSSASK